MTKHLFLTAALGLSTVLTAGSAKADPTPAEAACAKLGGTMALEDDCAAYDGNPGGVKSVYVCSDANSVALLITDTQNKTLTLHSTSANTIGTSVVIVADAFQLQLPISKTPNVPFDTVLNVSSIKGTTTIPLVCRDSK